MTAGQQAVIGRIEVPETLAERLIALGILEGTAINVWVRGLSVIRLPTR
ncbi:MAG: hypothetical protein ACLUB2_01365 [Butyricicoccus pullicaecorum]